VNPQEQRNFLKTILRPLISQAKKGNVQLFFVDASHFVQGGFIGQLWSKARIFVKSTSGRRRYNVLGALNFASKAMTTITNDAYITSEQVIMLIDKLLNEYPNQLIALVMDNARYQRCNLVKEYAALRGVQLVFLPTYSPNLNLIERVWKFVKSEVLNAAYISTFDEFCNIIDNCLCDLSSTHLNKMKTLVTGNFQLFDLPKESVSIMLKNKSNLLKTA
jgi:transposase